MGRSNRLPTIEKTVVPVSDLSRLIKAVRRLTGLTQQEDLILSRAIYKLDTGGELTEGDRRCIAAIFSKQEKAIKRLRKTERSH